MRGKTVVITGAAGFIGSHIAQEFKEKGWDVIGIGRGDFTNSFKSKLKNWHSADITVDSLIKHVENPDVIVHCAGGGSVGFSVNNPGIDFDMTVRTTAAVLDFIREHSPLTKFVYPSSAAVYGQVSKLPIVEETSLNPVSPYGVHKQMAEVLCEMYASQYGLSISILRLFSIYGLGLKKQLLWEACKKIQLGNHDFFGTGKEIRDWLHVSDVARLFFIAAQNASPICPIVNAGSGKGLSVKDVLQYLYSQYDFELKPSFSSNLKIGDPDAYIADISKASSWNWTPEINWHDGVSEYVDWYRRCQ